MANTVLKVTSTRTVTTISIVSLGGDPAMPGVAKRRVMKAFNAAADQRTDGWALTDDRAGTLAVDHGSANIVINHLTKLGFELVY